MARQSCDEPNHYGDQPGLLNRRALLQRGAGLGLGGAALAAAGRFDLAFAQDAPTGGTPVVIMPGEPPSLQPLSEAARVAFWVLDNVNSFLARYDPSLNIVPALATEWDYPDETSVRFKLREGVTFHNGEAMTAEDVKFSIEAHLDPAQASPIRTSLDAVDHVEVVDATTVVVRLKRPYAPLLDTLIDRVPILPRSVYATPGSAKESPVGCGPFKFSEWRKSSSIELARFDGYWEEGIPKIDGLSFIFLPEYNAAKSSFLSKQGDILLEFNATDLPTFQATDGVEVQSIYTLGFWWTGMNVQREPFTDVRVRQAVKYAIDRQQVVDLALGGRGAPATVPIPTDGPYYSPEFDYTIDVDRSKQLLADAGFADGLKVTLTVPKTSEEEPMGVVVQSQLKAVGIDAELEVLDVPNFLERVFTNRDYTIMIVGDTAGPDPAALLNRYYRSDSSSQVHNYNNAEVDRLLGEAASVTDTAQRRDLYKQALTIALDEAPLVWLARAELRTAYWDYLSDFVSLPTLRYEWWRLSFNREK